MASNLLSCTCKKITHSTTLNLVRDKKYSGTNETRVPSENKHCWVTNWQLGISWRFRGERWTLWLAWKGGERRRHAGRWRGLRIMALCCCVVADGEESQPADVPVQQTTNISQLMTTNFASSSSRTFARLSSYKYNTRRTINSNTVYTTTVYYFYSKVWISLQFRIWMYS